MTLPHLNYRFTSKEISAKELKQAEPSKKSELQKHVPAHKRNPSWKDK